MTLSLDLIYVKPYTSWVRLLIQTFRALADPTRLRLLNLMKKEEVCVCNLQEILGTNQPKISRHLSYLRRCQLVTARKEGKWVWYSLAEMDKFQTSVLGQAFKNPEAQKTFVKDAAALRKIQCC